ncbi:unnamed protein product [Toxocara canis]|uniref:SURF6 domain-containing protein n=1 Tax=Toxocara canis TaxID=6265 RepID=A0A183V689_TOXCA|nr:unnamed protein product [Toxocara canis]
MLVILHTSKFHDAHYGIGKWNIRQAVQKGNKQKPAWNEKDLDGSHEDQQHPKEVKTMDKDTRNRERDQILCSSTNGPDTTTKDGEKVEMVSKLVMMTRKMAAMKRFAKGGQHRMMHEKEQSKSGTEQGIGMLKSAVNDSSSKEIALTMPLLPASTHMWANKFQVASMLTKIIQNEDGNPGSRNKKGKHAEKSMEKEHESNINYKEANEKEGGDNVEEETAPKVKTVTPKEAAEKKLTKGSDYRIVHDEDELRMPMEPNVAIVALAINKDALNKAGYFGTSVENRRMKRKHNRVADKSKSKHKKMRRTEKNFEIEQESINDLEEIAEEQIQQIRPKQPQTEKGEGDKAEETVSKVKVVKRKKAKKQEWANGRERYVVKEKKLSNCATGKDDEKRVNEASDRMKEIRNGVKQKREAKNKGRKRTEQGMKKKGGMKLLKKKDEGMKLLKNKMTKASRRGEKQRSKSEKATRKAAQETATQISLVYLPLVPIWMPYLGALVFPHPQFGYDTCRFFSC